MTTTNRGSSRRRRMLLTALSSIGAGIIASQLLGFIIDNYVIRGLIALAVTVALAVGLWLDRDW